MKYGFATVSLPTLTPDEAVPLLARAGFTGVEFMVGAPPHGAGSTAEAFLVGNRCALEPDEGEMARVGALARAHGLEVIGIAPYVASGDAEAMDRALAAAVAIGAGQVRVQPPRRHPGRAREQRRGFADFLVATEPRARRAGVTIAIEVHQATVAPSVGLTLGLLDELDPEVTGVIYDVGNLVVEGYEDDEMALELLGAHLHHVHLKNARLERSPGGTRGVRWTALDDGLADVSRLLQLLERRGYDRWLSIEDLSRADDSAEAIRENAAALSRLGAPGWPEDRGTEQSYVA